MGRLEMPGKYSREYVAERLGDVMVEYNDWPSLSMGRILKERWDILLLDAGKKRAVIRFDGFGPCAIWQKG